MLFTFVTFKYFNMEQKKSADAQPQQDAGLQSSQSGKNNPLNGQAAHEAAEADMQLDPELNEATGPDDGLDEGELAKLEGED